MATTFDTIWLDARLATLSANRPGLGAVERGAEPDGARDVRRAGLEALRRVGELGLGKGNRTDHVAAALPGRH